VRGSHCLETVEGIALRLMAVVDDEPVESDENAEDLKGRRDLANAAAMGG